MSEATPRRALAKGLVFVGAATMVGNGAAYLLSMVSARVLTPADFGALGALLGLLVIISTVGIAMQAFTARRVAVATVDRPSAETNTWVPRIATSRLISVTVRPPSRSTLPDRAR